MILLKIIGIILLTILGIALLIMAGTITAVVVVFGELAIWIFRFVLFFLILIMLIKMVKGLF